MIFLLLLATVSVAFAGEENVEAKPELKSAESAQPIRVHDGEQGYRFEDGLELIRSRDARQRIRIEDYRNNNFRDSYRDSGRDDRRQYKDGDLPGPVVLRSPHPLPSHGHPDIDRQNKIIADVYSPDYYQPTWILDYRYLKTGGRDYTRGPGGQILILPKNVHTNEHKDFADFDSLLEHLRLSRLSENSRHSGSGHGHGHDSGHGYHNMGLGQYGRGYQHGDDHNSRHNYLNSGLGNYGRGLQQNKQNWWKANPNH